jgi:hypothetical protein
MYDNWTFSTPALWDEFWFSDLNSILYWSETFVVGESAVELAQIQCVPELNVYRDQIVEKSLFGIPLKTKNKIEEKLLYSRALNMNINMRIPVATTTFNSSNVHIPFKLDFTER